MIHAEFKFTRTAESQRHPFLGGPPVPPRPPGALKRTVKFVKRMAGFPDGPKLWTELHRRALEHAGGDDSAWLSAFEKRILGNCFCRKVWVEDVTANPPDFANYFAWTVAQHNLVNARLGKPVLTVEEARGIWAPMQPPRAEEAR